MDTEQDRLTGNDLPPEEKPRQETRKLTGPEARESRTATPPTMSGGNASSPRPAAPADLRRQTQKGEVFSL